MRIYVGGGFIGETTIGNSNLEEINYGYVGEKTLEFSKFAYGFLANEAPKSVWKIQGAT